MRLHAFRLNIFAAIAAMIVLCGMVGSAFAASVEEQRNDIRKMRQDTLTQLYKVHPAAKASIQKRLAMQYSAMSGST